MYFFAKHQKDLEDTFLLDCNPEDIKNDKEAKKAFKVIRKQGKFIKKIYKVFSKERSATTDLVLSILKNKIDF